MTEEIRLQKVIAAAGLASRREAERMIQAGRVQVNGRRVTKLGTRVDPAVDAISVDGQALSREEAAPIYLMLNKPRRVVSSASDERGRQTVMDLLGDLASARGENRVFHVGRLDYHSEGLLLLTNDGELAHALTHPSNQVPRVYRARLRGHPSPEVLQKLVAGVHLEDGMAAALDLEVVKRNEKSTWVEIGVAEGRNRLVRRLFDAINHRVQRLIRISYGGLTLGDLPPGAVRELREDEVAGLRSWMDAGPPGDKTTGQDRPERKNGNRG